MLGAKSAGANPLHTVRSYYSTYESKKQVLEYVLYKLWIAYG
jgi:hypothetical protein